MRDVYGRKIARHERDETTYVLPAGLRELRALFAYAVAMGGEILMADVGGAHLHARLRGSAVWASLEKHNQPGWWKRYTDPVVRLHKALYGLKRANFDWDQHHERVMILCSWSRVGGHRRLYVAKGAAPLGCVRG